MGNTWLHFTKKKNKINKRISIKLNLFHVIKASSGEQTCIKVDDAWWCPKYIEFILIVFMKGKQVRTMTVLFIVNHQCIIDNYLHASSELTLWLKQVFFSYSKIQFLLQFQNSLYNKILKT
jgi:hypothetical protein